MLATLIAHQADTKADLVKDGYWVEPPGSGGLIIFSVRAMPVQLFYAGSSDEDVKFTHRISQHRLLFLGQSNNQLVIYDATDQVSLILPGGERPATNRQQPTRNDIKRQGHKRCRSIAAGPEITMLAFTRQRPQVRNLSRPRG
jgi:hypothetical protein